LKGGDNMDRAMKMLENLRITYGCLLRMGVPEDKARQAIVRKLVSISEEDPELFEELAITAKFENLLS
jgi:hypothetical protein